MFSIIVPVYNTDAYLRECIDSIVAQSYDQYEVILVDDGSSDSSPQICDDYKEKYDDKIRVIHQTNRGPACARNVGLQCALGKYVLFLDSDDSFQGDDALSVLAGLIVQKDYPDILIPPRNGIQVDGEAGETVLKKMFDNWDNGKGIDIVVWDKVYKREIISTNKLYFIEGFVHEDIYWTPVCIANAGNVNNCPEFINHRIVESSISRSKSERATYNRAYSKINISRITLSYFDRNNIRIMSLYNFLIGVYFGGIREGISITDKTLKNRFLNRLKESDKVFAYMKSSSRYKYRVVGAIYHFLKKMNLP